MREKVTVLDFGAQYSQLIARRIRELGVYCEIKPFWENENVKKDPDVKAIILSGGPSSVFEKNSPSIPADFFFSNKPILGICYGMQLITHILKGEVTHSEVKEYGFSTIRLKDSILFSNLKSPLKVWMSHGDVVKKVPSSFSIIAESENKLIAAIEDSKNKIFGVQFHPEVTHTENGDKIFENFIFKIANIKPNWNMKTFIEEKTIEIKEFIKNRNVVTAVSGGVDSTVLSVFLNKILGKNLHCIFVNNGLLRKNEPEEVCLSFERLNIKVNYIDASKYFIKRLRKVTNPEKKRKIIGDAFLKIFFKEAGKIDILAQGTLYPDVIESVSVKGPSMTIKTHHNRVKGILKLIKENKILEPFKELFKDEVRKIGTELGIPEEIIFRQPFPGPGLAVRVLGEITEERLNILREADSILQEEIKKEPFYRNLWQSFCVLLPVKSVGVMGDRRTYENCIVLRIVESKDGMTANWSEIPNNVLRRISSRIVNEVKKINRVVYDITSKPPGTIEWE